MFLERFYVNFLLDFMFFQEILRWRSFEGTFMKGWILSRIFAVSIRKIHSLYSSFFMVTLVV